MKKQIVNAMGAIGVCLSVLKNKVYASELTKDVISYQTSITTPDSPLTPDYHSRPALTHKVLPNTNELIQYWWVVLGIALILFVLYAKRKHLKKIVYLALAVTVLFPTEFVLAIEASSSLTEQVTTGSTAKNSQEESTTSKSSETTTEQESSTKVSSSETTKDEESTTTNPNSESSSEQSSEAVKESSTPTLSSEQIQEKQNKAIEPTTIDNDFDPANGWTALYENKDLDPNEKQPDVEFDPTIMDEKNQGAFGYIPLSDGCKVRYTMGAVQPYSSTGGVYGSDGKAILGKMFIDEGSGTKSLMADLNLSVIDEMTGNMIPLFTKAGSNIFSVYNYSNFQTLSGFYFKKIEGTNQKALLCVRYAFLQGEKVGTLSILIYPKKDGTICVRDKYDVLENNNKVSLETILRLQNTPGKKTNFLKSLGKNQKGFYVENYDADAPDQRYRFNFYMKPTPNESNELNYYTWTTPNENPKNNIFYSENYDTYGGYQASIYFQNGGYVPIMPVPEIYGYDIKVDPIPKESAVEVFYHDPDGNELHSPQKITGRQGGWYDVSPSSDYQIDIPGYKLMSDHLPSSDITKGKFTRNLISVYYYYKPIANSVVVRYQDEDGNTIHPNELLVDGHEGEPYDVSGPKFQIEIPGYKLDKNKLPDNMTGTFSKEGTVVTYIYDKAPVEPSAYLEVPTNVTMYNQEDKAKGKLELKYHSLDDSTTEPKIDVSTQHEFKLADDEKDSVAVNVLQQDDKTPVVDATPFTTLSKDTPNYLLHLEVNKDAFKHENKEYTGNVTFTATFK